MGGVGKHRKTKGAKTGGNLKYKVAHDDDDDTINMKGRNPDRTTERQFWPEFVMITILFFYSLKNENENEDEGEEEPKTNANVNARYPPFVPGWKSPGVNG